MTETPNGAEAQRIVDDLEDDIIDVGKASEEQQPEHDDEQERAAEDVTGEVSDASEPTD